MFKSNKPALLFLLISGLYLTSFAQEETNVIKTLSKGADVILTGKVTQKESRWNNSRTRIYTETTVEVEEYLKGKNSEIQLKITTPGGEIGDVGELYTHMPVFQDSEEVLVFLKNDKKNKAFKVLNGEEGKITVFNDPKTDQKVTSSKLRMSDLKEQIKSYLKEK
jgi:hypothetical protein